VVELEPDEPKAVKAIKPEKIEKPSSPMHPTAAKLGLTLVDLTDDQKKEAKLKGGTVVEAASGAAATAGLRVGDIIVAIANSEILSAKEAEGVLARQDKSKSIPVQMRRGARGDYVLIKPDLSQK
jgi:serine protease Do